MHNSSMNNVFTWKPVELTFSSSKTYENPYLDVQLEVFFTSPCGDEKKAVGFWDGEGTWKIRFAPAVEGSWKWRSESNDSELSGHAGEFQAESYKDENIIHKHGFLKVSENGRGFVHEDGTPFFWLGDTVWSAAGRADIEEWRKYAKIRGRQGFNVTQITSLPQHDASGTDYRKPFAIKGEKFDLKRINPEYFQYLDKIIAAGVEEGIFPALVVLWFDYVPGANPTWGVKRKGGFTPELSSMYGRYITARYAAYGAIWMITGDTDFVNPEAIAVYDAAARAITEASTYVPLMTAHLNGGLYTPENLNNIGWLDFHMFQSSHNRESGEIALFYAEKDREQNPPKPVLNGEPCYEYLGYYMVKERISQETVRKVCWYSVLGGGNAGITYGAHGLWSWHRKGEYFKAEDTWLEPADIMEAIELEGANDAARLKEFVEKLQWWEMEPLNNVPFECQERKGIIASSIGSNIIVAYIPKQMEIYLNAIEGREYKAEWYNPSNGDTDSTKITECGDKILLEKCSWQGDCVLTLQW